MLFMAQAVTAVRTGCILRALLTSNLTMGTFPALSMHSTNGCDRMMGPARHAI